MGAAAYARGSKIIREQIDSEPKSRRPATEKAFEAGLEQGRREADGEIVRLRSEVARGRSAFGRMQGYLTCERRRRGAILAALQTFRKSFRGKGASPEAWTAIIAALSRAEID